MFFSRRLTTRCTCPPRELGHHDHGRSLFALVLTPSLSQLLSKAASTARQWHEQANGHRSAAGDEHRPDYS